MTCKKCGCVASVVMANGLCYHCNREKVDNILLDEFNNLFKEVSKNVYEKR